MRFTKHMIMFHCCTILILFMAGRWWDMSVYKMPEWMCYVGKYLIYYCSRVISNSGWFTDCWIESSCILIVGEIINLA